MAAIITEKFRQHNADQFFESFSEASKSTYYLFVGKATAFTSGTTGGSDSSPPTPSDGPTEQFTICMMITSHHQIQLHQVHQIYMIQHFTL
jgi:hypothetical protein